MLNKSISFQIVVAILAVGLFTQCNAQKSEKRSKIVTASAGATMPRPADEASIEVVNPGYEVKEANLEYLQSLPTPEFKLEFKIQDNFRTELPADVKSVLDSHWKEAVKFFYEEKFNKPLNAQDNRNRLVIWNNYCQKTEEKLQKLFISAPNGSRKISLTEADSFYGGLNQSALDIAVKAERIK